MAMLKTFFCHGFASGSRFTIAARGYEITKENSSFTSSMDAPVALERKPNAVFSQSMPFLGARRSFHTSINSGYHGEARGRSGIPLLSAEKKGGFERRGSEIFQGSQQTTSDPLSMLHVQATSLVLRNHKITSQPKLNPPLDCSHLICCKPLPAAATTPNPP